MHQRVLRPRWQPLMVALILTASLLSPTALIAESAVARLPDPVETLPVGKSDVYAFEETAGVDRQPTIASLPGGGFVLVYSRYERGGMGSSRMRIVRSTDGHNLSSSEVLNFGAEIEDAPSFVTLGDSTWLYFASGDADLGNVKLWRTRLLDDQRFASPERLPDVPGLQRLIHWPRWVGTGSAVFLTFRAAQSRPYWLRLKDGSTPEPAQQLSSLGVAYARVVPMTGGCVFSYQRPPEGGYMATYVSLSPDCSTWSPITAVAWPDPPGKPDVHDAYAFPRSDQGVDLYYVYPSRKGPGARFPIGFDLYRRAVMPDGRMGPEEALTARDEFTPFAPTAHRLVDGSILVSFSDIHASGNQGVSSARLSLFQLSGDAVAPSGRSE